MRAGDRLYLPYADTIETVEFVEDGTGDHNLKRRPADPVVVRDPKSGSTCVVSRGNLYESELAAATRSAELAEQLEREECE